MLSIEARFSSNVISAVFLGSETSTFVTPGTEESAWVTLPVQPPQVMPDTLMVSVFMVRSDAMHVPPVGKRCARSDNEGLLTGNAMPLDAEVARQLQ